MATRKCRNSYFPKYFMVVRKFTNIYIPKYFCSSVNFNGRFTYTLFLVRIFHDCSFTEHSARIGRV